MSYVCGVCARDAYDSDDDPARRDTYGEPRYSLGLYAGTYCDAHWALAGYRDDDASGFDPADAGESWGEPS